MIDALIVVDVQNDFCEGGALAVAGGNDVAHRIAEFLEPPQLTYDFVVATLDWHIDPGDHFSETPDYVNTWPEHCVALTAGARMHEALPGSSVIDEFFFKGQYSAAYSGFEGAGSGLPLSQWLHLNEVTAVDICGIATDYCVKATALDAVKLGFHTTLITDLCAAVSPEGEQAALAEMEAAGVVIGA